VEFVRAVPLLWAWLLVVLAAPLVAMRANYEWCAAALACVAESVQVLGIWS
jgi:hypothetical protein